MANLVMGYRLASRTPCSSLALLSTDKEMVLFGNALSLPRTAFNTIFLQRYIISHPEPCIHASICEGKKKKLHFLSSPLATAWITHLNKFRHFRSINLSN